MNSLLEKLLQSPDIQLVIDQAKAVLWEEKKKRQEFYKWLKPDVKAEFINGEIIIHSPVKRRHLDASDNLNRLLSIFVDKQQLGICSTEKALISLTRNDYEPDICFWNNEKASVFNGDTMLHPAPDFIVEILSKGTAKRDRGVKFQDYAAHGIKEYWIVDAKKQLIEQYVLTDITAKEYELLKKYTIEDTIESIAVTGFTIPIAAIFDKARNLEVLALMLQ